MPAVDPNLIALAEARLAADPRVQRLRQSQGRAQGGGAVDPRQFGIDYLPPGYVYSIRSGKVVDQNDYADWLIPTIAGAGMTLGATGIIPGFGGLGGAASQAPQLGNVNGTIDALQGASGAAHAGGLLSPLAPGAADWIKAGATGVPAVLSAVRGLGGGDSGPFGGDQAGLVDEIRQSLASQRERFDATRPAFDTAQRMAVGMAPVRYRAPGGPFGGG